MPRRKSSIKRKRADKKKHLRNLRVKKELKKTLKKFQALVSANSIKEAQTLLKEVFSRFDKAAKKRIIHPKTADRKKSRLAKRLIKKT
ncbi:MAG: 30S ribosomal protein S20 [Candidatus Omnitrophica bacterium]|nr:30S ribosomal protein S20 [Candidatus Omnitrophota bacterium]MBU1906246.1 30S ribosomal protein S20 [Candidatus Omnitrophota bacterium]